MHHGLSSRPQITKDSRLAVTNASPKPLIWTATAESILEKVRRGRVALNRSANTETHH